MLYRTLNSAMLPVYRNGTVGLGWHKKSSLIGTQSIFALLCSFFCQGNELAAKAVFLLDNAPGHLENLSEVRILLDVSDVYMPRNTTPLVQPMDWEVRATLKAYYFCQTFVEMVRFLDGSDKTIKDYWGLFDILKGINNINAAWEEVSVNYLNGLWHQLLPDFMHDFTGFEPVENIVEVISRLAQDVELDKFTAESVT